MSTVRLRLLGSFALSIDGGPDVESSPGEQRLIVLLALRDRVVSRASVAAALWPDTTSVHAALRLRSALARLGPTSSEAITSTASGLRLKDHCAVDYRDARRFAELLLTEEKPSPLASTADTRAAIGTLCQELLPDSFDEWVLAEAEDWRLQRAAALEKLACLLSASGQQQLAVEAARAAVRNEPLRETAHAELIRAHLAAGNQSEAARAYEHFATALNEALQLTPSPALRELVDGVPQES